MKLSLKISLLASVVGVFFVLLVFSNTYRQIVANEELYTIKKYQDDLKDLTSSFDLVLNKATEAISLLSLLQKGVIKKNPSLLSKRFEVLMKTIPQINKVKFISLSGKELVKVSRERLFEKLSEKSYLKEKIFKITMNDKLYYSDIYFSKNSNEMMIDIAKLVKDLATQEVLGVITVQVSMESIQELISNKLINGNGIALLNVKNNQYLYKSSVIESIDDSLDYFSKLKEVAFVKVDNVNYVVVQKDYSFDRLRMKIIMTNSNKNIFLNIDDAFIKNVEILLVIILLLSVAMFIFVNYLLSPLRSLKQEINRLSKEINQNEDIEEDKNLNELETIKSHFYLFVKLITDERKKLEEYNKNLELEVAKEVRKNKEKEKLMAHQSKMASMGEMIENIAHQWRQPLSVISTSSSGLILQKKLHKISEDEEFERLEMIVKTSQHLSDTITSFRDFFSQNKDKAYCNIKNICENTLDIIGTKFKNKNIDIITNLKDVNLNTYDSELIQVIMNILTNAHDALEQVSSKKLIFIDTYSLDENAIVVIKDNAGGIPKDIIDKIFEPYFTTKFKSNGTGIGLYMSQEIISKNIGGTLVATNETINYEDKEYTGAVFTITIPIVT